jgi:hypothetical protein
MYWIRQKDFGSEVTISLWTLTAKDISELKEVHKIEQLGMTVYKDRKPAHNSK